MGRGFTEILLTLTSSRSGFRVLEGLISRRFVFRDGSGKITLSDEVADCETQFLLEEGT
jgi:hypothetical protein